MPSKFTLSVAAAAALLTAGLGMAPASASDVAREGDGGSSSFAVIGDTPYGAAAVSEFPSHLQDLNADKELSFVAHLGDIKNGSTVCSDAYFEQVKADFDTLTHPLVYTPGDNEWTDCHRANNGSYNPLERLSKLRQVFFADPGKTLGSPAMPVKSQADRGIPENVQFSRNRVAFTAVNVPGSNNSLDPWTGLGQTSPTPEQVAEVSSRTDAVIAEIRDTFTKARQRHDRAVVIMQQADMFDPTWAVTWNEFSAFKPIIETLIKESNGFDGPVYLFDGDSHVYNADRPLAAGSTWLDFYSAAGHADNLRRVTIDGSSNARDYLRVTVNPVGTPDDVLNWTRVPFTHN